MAELINPQQTTYWIAYSNDKSVVHYGKTEPTQSTTTGQPNFDTFATKEFWETALLDEFNINPNENQNPELPPI